MDGNCPFSRGKTPTRYEEDRGVVVSYKCDMTDCELWSWGDNKCKFYTAAEAIEGIYSILAERYGRRFTPQEPRSTQGTTKVDTKPLTKQTEKVF